MKTSIRCFTHRLLRLFFLAFAAGIFAAPVARAGLTFEMDLVRYEYGYYANSFLVTNPTPANIPFGTYLLASPHYPTNGFFALYQFNTNGFNQIDGFPYGFYGDFDSLIQGLTNGTWSIFATNSVATNVYYFTVASHIISNEFPRVSITFPADGAVNITNQPTFTWQGPANFGELAVYEYNNSSYLPPTQTNWPSPSVLYQGMNSFTVHYYSNYTTALVASLPTNNASQSIASWISKAHLDSYSSHQFTVGTVDGSGTSHTLVAHYTWDGTNADGTASGADTSGNGYDMNFGGGSGTQGGTNSTTDHAAGPRAIQFHNGDYGSAGYVGWNPTPTNLLAALAGSFSISCWIKTTQNGYGSDQAPAYYGAGIVSADIDGLANDVVPIALTGNTIGFNTGGDVEDVTLNSVATVNDGNYHHVVVTRNQSTGQKIIYIDGVLDSFSSGTTNLLNAPQLLTLGALSDASDPAADSAYYYNGYDGLLDDLQIYSGVLSSNEVRQLYNNPGVTANQVVTVPLVARYNFESTNSPGMDNSGNGNDANCSSGNGGTNLDTFSTDAAVGNFAREYFGDTSICFFRNGAACFDNLSNALSGSFSWTVWVKTTNSVNADDANAYFGALIWQEYSDPVNQLNFSITGSKAAFTVGNPGGGSDTTLHSTTSVNDGSYHFLAATRNFASGMMNLYVDGILEATGTSTNGPRIVTATMFLAGGNNANFEGLLDDVRVYGGELSAADVATLSGHPPAGVTSGGHKIVAQYTFDTTNKNTYDLGLDSSPNGNNMITYGYWGMLHTNSIDAMAGGGAVEFFGTSRTICYDQVLTNLNAVLAGSFTFSAWVKSTVTNGEDYNNAYFGAVIFWAYNDHGNTNDTIPLSITGSKAAFTTRDHLGNNNTLHSITSVNDGNYHLITVTRNQDSGEKKMYVDGNFEASEIGTADLLNGNDYDLSIGGYAYVIDGTGTNFSSYRGLLDDLQIYSGVLSGNEVAYLYSHPGSNVLDTAGQDFNAALNTTNLNWITGGDADWFVETTNTHDHASAAQSGSVTDNQTSTISVTVMGPGNLTFYWSSIAEDPNFGFDYEFDIDGNYTNDIYGDTGWQQAGPYGIGPGMHTLSWTVNAYGDTDPTQAGFLDRVTFAPPDTNAVSVVLLVNIYRSQDASLGDIFYAFVNINSITPAATGTTTNIVESTGGRFHGEANSSHTGTYSIILSSFAELMNEFTNGLWTLYINKGMVNERQFHFSATATGLITNLLSAVQIITPNNGATGIAPNTPFLWRGPTNYSSLDVSKAKFDGSENVGTSLAANTTNWPAPPTLSAGTNRFYITYVSNNFPGITFSVPVDNASLTVSNWSTQFDLYSTAQSIFIVTGSGALPVQLLNVGQTGDSFQFSFTSQASINHAVQYRTNLIAGSDWQTYTNITGDGTAKTVLIPLSVFNPASQGFVRVSSQ